jgi:hypothetical protein
VPESTPVTVSKVTPEGSLPLSPKVGAGTPVAITVNEPARPSVNWPCAAEVNTGADPIAFTVRVKLCVASGATPLVAVKVACAAEVIVGAAPVTVRVKLWTASGGTPLPAVKVS